MTNKKNNFESFRNTQGWDLGMAAKDLGITKGELVRRAIRDLAKYNDVNLHTKK